MESNPPLGAGDKSSITDTGATKYSDPARLFIDPNYQIPPNLTGYKPNKRQRNIRRQVYIRYYQMRDNDWRTEAERDWQHADQEYQMWFPGGSALGPTSTNTDWQSHPNRQTVTDMDGKRSKIRLPDSFAAIQAHMQENLERRSRPRLTGTESSDEPIEEFANSLINYNMNNTDFDYQWYMAGIAAAIRGTAFIYDYYRVDKRWVKDVEDVDAEGKLTYKEKQITDFDDDYSQWLPNEFCYIDEKARHINDAVDGVRREILNIREFQRIYGMKKDCINVEFVQRGGDVSTRAFFKLPRDISGNDVEVLHYYNRALDVYWITANWTVIRDGPIPWKHKEIPFAVRCYYRVPGRFWGMGIPKVLMMLAEERNSIRNLNMDRQNLQINKMFLHNNLYDITEEDLISRPHGLISVDAGNQKLDDVLKPLEYGDVPASYFKTEQIMIEDIIRATGIDTRLTDVPQGTTATSAAITKETMLKRVNMLSTLDEMDTIIRLGRLKWSNIQFFYPLGRMDIIHEDNEERQEQVFKTITSNGRKFRIQNENGQPTLKMEDITGSSSFILNKKMAKYIEGSFDVTVDSTQFTPVSRVIQQTKATEMFSLLMGNPATLSKLDVGKAISRLLSLNDEQPKDWLTGFNQDPGTTMLAAETENRVMAAGQPLAATPGATEEHTLVHLMFTESTTYQSLPPHVKQIFAEHIMGEHGGNPATGTADQALSANGLGGNQAGQPGSGATGTPAATPAPFIGQLPNLPALGLTSNINQPQAQVADIQATNFGKPTRTGV